MNDNDEQLQMNISIEPKPQAIFNILEDTPSEFQSEYEYNNENTQGVNLPRQNPIFLDQARDQGVESILNQKCLEHTSFNRELLILNDDFSSNNKVCLMCVQKHKIPLDTVLSIRELLGSTDGSLLLNYPPLKNQPLKRVLKTLDFSIELITSQIDTYFRKCREDFLESLSNAKKKAMEKVEELKTLKLSCQKAYQEITEIQDLKKIVSSMQSDAEEQLHSFLQEKWDNSNKNAQTIQKLTQEYNQIVESFSLVQPIELYNTTVRQIKELDLFAGKPLSSNKQSKDKSQMIDDGTEISLLNRVGVKNSSSYKNSTTHLKTSIKTNKFIEMVHAGKSNGAAQCYLDFVLNPEKLYVLKIELTQKQGNDPSFLIGLIPEYFKDSEFAGKFQLSYCENYNLWGITKMMKGKQLHSGVDGPLVKRTLEMRIYMLQQLIQVSSVPGQEEIAELAENNALDLSIPYRIAFHMFYMKDQIRILEFKTVNSFDKYKELN